MDFIFQAISIVEKHDVECVNQPITEQQTNTSAMSLSKDERVDAAAKLYMSLRGSSDYEVTGKKHSNSVRSISDDFGVRFQSVFR